jgi:hypothetical protein
MMKSEPIYFAASYNKYESVTGMKAMADDVIAARKQKTKKQERCNE